MIRRPPRSTQSRSSAASDVYKRQFLWRPRPRIVLPVEKEKELNNNFNKFAKKYEEHDDRIVNAAKYEEERRREEMKKEFLAYMEKKRSVWESAKDERVKLRGFDEDNMSDVTIEEIIESEELIA
eukprot:TRINITY_DN920_c0_g2_i5.p4 TRINITY_DN920_c0_g2~~TRINITY_DN920_c0_g2_i5.p4  ORF type:complete len:125 (-),score=87.05 TRINITY_DN920_c0_g2_i5:58-432(-)